MRCGSSTASDVASLLLSGLAGMAVSLIALAATFALGQGSLLGILTAASLAAYVACFAIGLGPVFWLLISEILLLAIRARGMSAATIANWLANLAVALTFLDLVDAVGRVGVFVLYAGLTAGAHVFARRMVPETRGLDLEAVETLWLARSRDAPLFPHDPKLPT
ncbi:MAG: MFS transporter [Janthinobacterium lividum]